ncbi:hypothetical protein [Mycoplasmopsis alligatoris]|uniref:Uncharacterized protein n=1 Tax=Mycoplasmopsis alligatoris A21JP2 TaxID=747682 RepID=D4XV67_9BACT|nr:hypothetical protein [Mycoplasmopsis alligatoris]EFF41774.1 conserved hypothetical protein [Mycoplasmopsis alligatoris A21JP2]
MKIKFLSISLQNERENKIEFTSELTRRAEEEYDVLFFHEPSQKIANQIEISKTRVNIFAGPTTLILKLNQWVENPFEQVFEGKTNSFSLFTYLHSLEFDQATSTYNFKYEIAPQAKSENLIGEFNVKLVIE